MQALYTTNRVVVIVMVFNATFNNISVISWQSVLLVEETGIPEENQNVSGSILSFTYYRRIKSQLWLKLCTLPEHLSSPPVFSGVHVTRSLVLCVCFVDRCLSFCTFFFWPLWCLFFFDIRLWLPPFGIFKLSLYHL